MTSPYKRRVRAYLVSEWGRDTPVSVAARLRELDPKSIGMGPSPGLAAIHATRAYLQVMLWTKEKRR